MINVLLSRRWGSSRIGIGAIGFLSGGLVLLAASPTLAQTQPPAAKARPATPDTAKAKSSAADDAQAPDVAPVPVADPSQTRKVATIEVFKDPNIEAYQLLDATRFRPLPSSPFTPTELLELKQMAANKNIPPDPQLINRVVKGLAAKLTDRAGIQALIEMPDEEAPPAGAAKDAIKKANVAEAARSEAAKAIPQATADLLEPLFKARGVENRDFLRDYQRALNQWLPPVLSNHLISRVQAMIVLGESGSSDALATFEKEIANAKQTLWVKLWAIEGIKKIKEYGGRPTTDDEAKAGKIISEFLDKEKALPWPVQLRALEALAVLRQGFLPNQPQKIHMASSAMRFLADPGAKLEVRAEAARALGQMQITSAVNKFNFPLVAHAAGLLAADLGTEINSLYPDTGRVSENLTKAKYLTALLIGPVYQSFEGVSRDSGLLRIATPPALTYVQQVFNLVKEVAQSSFDLLNAPPKQYKDRKKSLASQIEALRGFLDKNPPSTRRLVPDGQDFVANQEAGARVAESIQPIAGIRRGR